MNGVIFLKILLIKIYKNEFALIIMNQYYYKDNQLLNIINFLYNDIYYYNCYYLRYLFSLPYIIFFPFIISNNITLLNITLIFYMNFINNDYLLYSDMFFIFSYIYSYINHNIFTNMLFYVISYSYIISLFRLTRKRLSILNQYYLDFYKESFDIT